MSHSNKPARTRRLADGFYQAGEYFLMSYLVPRRRPGPIFSLFFKLPVWYDRLGLRFLIPPQVLLLTTIGRKSGKPRTTALGFAHDSTTDTYRVTCGWDGKTDWFRNLTANPNVRVRVGSRAFDCKAELVDLEAYARLMQEYSAHNPFAARLFANLYGITLDGTESGLDALMKHMPMVVLHPPR